MPFSGVRPWVLIACMMGSAQAAEGSSEEPVLVHGFGTLGAVVTNDDSAQFRGSFLQSKGAARAPNGGVDSALGLQANVRLGDSASAVAQVLTSRRQTDRPKVEWLYGQVDVADGTSLRLGRMVLPAFMFSDSRSVGFAAHWLRAPSEVYSLYPATSFDGIQLQYRNLWGGVHVTAQLSTGEARERVFYRGVELDVRLPSVRSLNLVLDSGNWRVRFGQTDASRVVFGGLSVPLLNDKFTGLGVQYDDQVWLLASEYIRRRENTPHLFESDSWYVSMGRRFGAWLPYLSLSSLTPKGPGFLSQARNETSALGVRWDWSPSVAWKAQWESSRGNAESFVGGSADFYARRPVVRVLSATVDFIF